MTIEIWDAGGVKVRTIERTGLAAANHTVEWDGRTDSGRWVANGVYIFKVSADTGGSAIGKVMVAN